MSDSTSFSFAFLSNMFLPFDPRVKKAAPGKSGFEWSCDGRLRVVSEDPITSGGRMACQISRNAANRF
jgi:hypothetical protein